MIPLIIAATAVETIGAIREGQTQSALQKYNARVAEAEAGAVKSSAEFEIEALKTSTAFETETLKRQSEFEQTKIKRAKGQAVSTQQAAFAKAGVRLDEGSPLEVMADTAAQFELDLAANRYNLGIGLEKTRYESEAEQRRIGYGSAVKQAQLYSQAAWNRQLAKASKTAAYLKAGSTLLSGGYSIAKAKINA